MDRAVENLRVRSGGASLPDSVALGGGFDGDVAANIDAPAPPPVFARVITVRPSAPWDQNRAARLEARLNAPLPIDQVAFVLQRSEPWRPGQPGRFVAAYARRQDVREGLVRPVEVEGGTVTARFPAPGKLRQRARQVGAIASVTTVSAFLTVVAIGGAWNARTEAESRLQTLEAQTARRLADARRQDRLRDQTQALDSADLQSRRAAFVLDDLEWAERSRSPDVRIEAFFREGELLAVEVRGDGEPFPGSARKVERSSRAIRNGVWLWGVAPAAAIAEPRL